MHGWRDAHGWQPHCMNSFCAPTARTSPLQQSPRALCTAALCYTHDYTNCQALFVVYETQTWDVTGCMYTDTSCTGQQSQHLHTCVYTSTMADDACRGIVSCRIDQQTVPSFQAIRSAIQPTQSIMPKAPSHSRDHDAAQHPVTCNEITRLNMFQYHRT